MSCNRKRDHEQDPLQPRIAVSSFSCCCSWRYEPSSCPVPPRPLEQPSRPRPMPASAASLLTSPAKAPQAGRRAAAHHAARSPKCRCAQSGGTAPRLSRISTPFAGACHIKISSCRAFTCVSDGIASIECLARWHCKKCTTDNVVISLQVRLQEANARAQPFSEIAATILPFCSPSRPSSQERNAFNWIIRVLVLGRQSMPSLPYCRRKRLRVHRRRSGRQQKQLQCAKFSDRQIAPPGFQRSPVSHCLFQ